MLRLLPPLIHQLAHGGPALRLALSDRRVLSVFLAGNGLLGKALLVLLDAQLVLQVLLEDSLLEARYFVRVLL